ncbi:MAG: hypothetical protein CMJ94_01405 [Planctomycetes bacterium]|nr:hypothetical protein [Planctomycetota bacterium]
MLLSLTISMMAQFSASPQQPAPFGLPSPNSSAGAISLQQGPAVVEDFEAYTIAVGSAELTGSSVIFEGTITGTGQGPGLVLPGCSYYCDPSGSIQWNGDTYFGLDTKKILATVSDARLGIRYYTPQASVSMNLHAFDGFPDNALVEAYDSTGALVDTVGPLVVPDSSPVPITLTGPNIARVEINSLSYPWSPIIDNHDYDTGTSCGLQLSASGSCPGPMTFTVNGGAPGDPCKFGYAFGTGSYVIPGGPCGGTVTGLDATATPLPGTYFFDGAGQVNQTFFVPPAACGAVYVQAINLADCCTSNVIAL